MGTTLEIKKKKRKPRRKRWRCEKASESAEKERDRDDLHHPGNAARPSPGQGKNQKRYRLSHAGLSSLNERARERESIRTIYPQRGSICVQSSRAAKKKNSLSHPRRFALIAEDDDHVFFHSFSSIFCSIQI